MTDGDTLTVLAPDRRQVRFRLTGDRAPEIRQPWPTRNRRALSCLASRKWVVVPSR